jgi:hypothetical protein
MVPVSYGWRKTALGRRLVIVVMYAIAGISALPAHAQQHHLECPRDAPAAWGLIKPAPLDQAAVLSSRLVSQ